MHSQFSIRPLFVALPIWLFIWLIVFKASGSQSWLAAGTATGISTWIILSVGLVATRLANESVIKAYALFFLATVTSGAIAVGILNAFEAFN